MAYIISTISDLSLILRNGYNADIKVDSSALSSADKQLQSKFYT